MSSLKELKNRLHVARSTSKITAAMKLIATSKFRKLKKLFDATTSSAKAIQQSLSQLKEFEPDILNSPLWNGYTAPSNTELLFVGTSYKGLCAGFNTNLLKLVETFISRCSTEKTQIEIIFLGTKGFETLRRSYATDLLIEQVNWLENEKTLENSVTLSALKIIEHIESTGYQKVSLASNLYKSAISQKPTITPIFPLNEYPLYKQPFEVKTIPEIEPSIAEFREAFLKEVIFFNLVTLLTENKLCEHAARMNAMDSAENNASDLINDLSLEYNKSRQSVITRELLEIIAGKEAL